MKKQLFLRLACFSVFTLLGFCLVQEVNAATLSSYNHYYSNEYNGTCGTSNKYTYSMIDSMGNWTYSSGTIGTVYSGKANAFYFDFTYDLTANTYYDIVINAPTNDFTQVITSSLVSVGNGTTCGATNLNNISLVSVTKGASSGQYKKLTIRIFSATSVDYWTIGIENDSSITGVSTFGISSLSITEVDLSGTDIIVDNANSNTDSIINNQQQNTSDIINNQNQNNEELKDTINDNFNTCHFSKNLWNNDTYFTNVESGLTKTETGFTFYRGNITGGRYVANFIEVEKGKTYTFSIDGGSSNSPLIIYLDNVYGTTLAQGTNTLTYTPTETTTLIFTIALGSPVTSVAISNIQVELGSTKTTYEAFGQEICTNKLDEQVETSKGILGTLKSVFTSIVELPKKIVDLLVDGLKSLFVPDGDEMNQLIDNFKQTTSEKLGVIYQAGDLLIGIFQNIIDDSTPENACLTFPELKVPNVDQPIIEETDFCFNEITDKIPILLTTIRGISGVFITLTFINMLKKKYDDFINGGEL